MSWWRSRRCSATLLVLLCCPVLIGTFYYQALTGSGPADNHDTLRLNGLTLTDKLQQQLQQQGNLHHQHRHRQSDSQSRREKEELLSQTVERVGGAQSKSDQVATDVDRNNPRATDTVQQADAAAAAAAVASEDESHEKQPELDKSIFLERKLLDGGPESFDLVSTVAAAADAVNAPAAVTAVPPRRDVVPYRPTASREEIRQLWKSFMESRSTSLSSASNSNVPSRPEVGARDAVHPSSSSSAGLPFGDGKTGNLPQQQKQQRFIPYRCPTSFNITDPQDDWFRREVVQRSPLTSQFHVDDEPILILTPVSNVARHLHRFFENLCSLTYPHRLLSVVLGEDSSTDGTYEKAKEMADELGSFFQHMEVVRLRDTAGGRRTGNARHDASWQLIRRRHLAMARNRLLTHALGSVGRNVRWILWMDSDVRHVPRDLIRHLLSANQSMVTANCLWRQDNGQTATFDRNTWQETEQSRAELRNMKPDELKLEGYSDTNRRFLNDLKDQGDVVPIDGVGGCVLLVEADLHRAGLVFPPFVFDHHIETEGLAKMAAKLGIRMYGLPSVNLIHW